MSIINALDQMIKESDYHLVVRDSSKDVSDDKFIDSTVFVEICADYSLCPFEVFETLRKHTVYILFRDEGHMKYFILYNTDVKRLYGFNYRRIFGL